MARIKIEELPVIEEIGDQEMKGILGGIIIVGGKDRGRSGAPRNYHIGRNVVSRLRGGSANIRGGIGNAGNVGAKQAGKPAFFNAGANW